MPVKIRLTLFLTIALLLTGTALFAQQYRGTYSFLDASFSPRVAALGGTMLAIDDSDINLGVFNPSLINHSMHNNISLSYVDYFADINFASAQYARSFEKIGNFLATVQYQNFGTTDQTDEAGNITGTFNMSNYNVIIGWGRQLDSRFSIGANFKLIGTQYDSYGSFALAVDVAGSYRSETGWMFSLAARNIGTELKAHISGDGSALPFSMQAGIAKKLDHVPFLFSIVFDNIQKWDLRYDDPLDLDSNYDPMTGKTDEDSGIEKFGDNLMRHLIFGGEFYIGKNIVLRGSYNYKRRQEMKMPDKSGMVGFSWGVGIRVSKFHINYARSTYHAVGSPNYISISTNLDSFLK